MSFDTCPCDFCPYCYDDDECCLAHCETLYECNHYISILEDDE